MYLLREFKANEINFPEKHIPELISTIVKKQVVRPDTGIILYFIVNQLSNS